MTANPILINSANIIQFGLGITFDIGANTITFDSSPFTEYQSGGAANVQGIYIQIFDASGLEVKPLDLTTPDILPSAPVPYVLHLPNGFAQYGMFILNAIIIDADSTQYPINLRKNICQPDNFANNVVSGQFIATVDCDTPRIILAETTNFSYQGQPPLSLTKNGNLYYPMGTLSPVAFDFTPFEVSGTGNVYTGPYRIKNITTALYDLLDNVSVKINYSTLLDFSVACGSKLVNLLCCVNEVYQIYNTDPNSNRGRDAKVKIEKITAPFITAVIKDKAGQKCDDEINTISKILQCNCACDPQSVEPLLLSASNAGPSFTIQGQYGTTVTPVVIGSSTQYTVKSTSYFVTKDSGELGFSIQTIASAGAISYKIIFNYNALAANILTTIGNSVELTAQFNALIDAAGGNLSLAGLEGGCVITIASCNYRLIEPITPVKTVVSITIDGTVHNAPGSLLLTNVSGIAAWLNGLSLGTFTANLDGGSNNVIIESDTNTHILTQFALSVGSSPLLRQFTAVCTTLVDVLNAIITYLCAIDATKVAFGVASQNICTYDDSGNVVTTVVDPTIKLGALISDILNAQCALYGKIASIALTCTNLKTLLIPNTLTFIPTDGLFGTRGDDCAKISWIDSATQLLSIINSTPALQAAFCAIMAQCTGVSCPAPANVSASLTSGTMTVNANNVAGVTSVTIRYRLNNSGNTYTEVTISPSALPYAITGLSDGQYEVGMQSLCSNGALSQWTTAVSPGCDPLINFGVVQSGSNFAISASLAGVQTIVEVQMTDPNGGLTTTIHDFGTGVHSGTFNITIPATPGIYSFIARGVCDNTSSPRFVSAFTAASSISIGGTPANNFSAIASYGIEITSIVNGSATGVPSAFATMTLVNATQNEYTPQVTAGTISVVLAGTLGPPSAHLQLVVNGAVVSSVPITGPSTYTLTLGTTINAPTTLSVQINTP